MKITIFQQAPDIGGSETYMANLVGQWTNRGDKIVAFTNNQEYITLLKKNGAQTRNLPIILDITGNLRGFIKSIFLLPIMLIWYLKTLLLMKDKTDIIVMSGYAEKFLVTYLTKYVQIPVIWLEYPPMEELLNRNFKIPKFIYLICSKIPKKIIAISNHTLKSLVNETNIPKEKVKLIYPGVKLLPKREMVIAKLSAQKIKKKLNLKSKYIIGNISRIAKEKGQEHLIKALPIIKQRIPKVSIIIVGRGPDQKRLRKMAKRLNIQSSVHFLGFVENIYATLSMMDVFVFTSTWSLEGFGLVIAEAMLSKIPVIAFNRGPIPEIITNNKTGILVKSGNTKKLAHALIKVLKDKELATRFSKNAFEDAKSRFSIKNSAILIQKELQFAIKTDN